MKNGSVRVGASCAVVGPDESSRLFGDAIQRAGQVRADLEQHDTCVNDTMRGSGKCSTLKLRAHTPMTVVGQYATRSFCLCRLTAQLAQHSGKNNARNQWGNEYFACDTRRLDLNPHMPISIAKGPTWILGSVSGFVVCNEGER